MIFSWLCIIILVALWVYFFIYSYRRNVGFPWGFGIVIIGMLVLGYGYTFYITQVGFFSINILFLVSLFGIFWNISSIREQVHIRNKGEFLRFLGIGLMFGLLFGFSQTALLGFEYFRIYARFNPIALIASAIQISTAEELLFRGYLLNYLREYGFNPAYAIVFQSLIFTALHISRYSDNLLTLCIIFFVGVVTGYLTWKSNNLIPAITIHIIGNLIGVIWWLATI